MFSMARRKRSGRWKRRALGLGLVGIAAWMLLRSGEGLSLLPGTSSITPPGGGQTGRPAGVSADGLPDPAVLVRFHTDTSGVGLLHNYATVHEPGQVVRVVTHGNWPTWLDQLGAALQAAFDRTGGHAPLLFVEPKTRAPWMVDYVWMDGEGHMICTEDPYPPDSGYQPTPYNHVREHWWISGAEYQRAILRHMEDRTDWSPLGGRPSAYGGLVYKLDSCGLVDGTRPASRHLPDVTGIRSGRAIRTGEMGWTAQSAATTARA